MARFRSFVGWVETEPRPNKPIQKGHLRPARAETPGLLGLAALDPTYEMRSLTPAVASGRSRGVRRSPACVGRDRTRARARSGRKDPAWKGVARAEGQQSARAS